MQIRIQHKFRYNIFHTFDKDTQWHLAWHAQRRARLYCRRHVELLIAGLFTHLLRLLPRIRHRDRRCRFPLPRKYEDQLVVLSLLRPVFIIYPRVHPHLCCWLQPRHQVVLLSATITTLQGIIIASSWRRRPPYWSRVHWILCNHGIDDDGNKIDNTEIFIRMKMQQHRKRQS